MQIVIHGINRREKTSPKNGKKFISMGIKYRGKWYSGFEDEISKNWDQGMQVEVDLWDEPGSDGKMYGKFVAIKPQHYKAEMHNDAVRKQQEETQSSAGDDAELEDLPEENQEKKEAQVDDLPF